MRTSISAGGATTACRIELNTATQCAPKRMTQFDELLADLSNQLDRMEKLLAEHAELLRPIRREFDDGKTPTPSAPQPVLVPLADELRNRAVRLGNLVDALTRINASVEL